MGKSGNIGNPFSKLTIANKLLGWFLLVALAPSLLAGYISYNNSVKAVKKEVINNLNTIADNKSQNIMDYINQEIVFIETLSYTPAVINALKKYTAAFNNGIDSHEYLSVDNEFRPFLTYCKEKKIRENEISNLLLVSPEGDVVFSVDREDDFGTSLIMGDYSNSELSKAFNNVKTLLATEMSEFSYCQASKKPAAFIVSPVLEKGNFLGAISTQLNTKTIYALSQDYSNLGKTGEIVIAKKTAGKNEAVIIAPLRNNPNAAFKVKRPISSRNPLKQAFEGQKGCGMIIDSEGRENLAAWRYIPYLRWGLVIKIDSEEAFASIYRLKRVYLFLGLLTVLGVAIIALFVSKTISRPIIELTKTTELMAGGNLTAKAKVETDDEIGKLAQSFNYMVKKRRYAETALRKKEEEWRSLVTNAPDVIMRIDYDSNIRFVNRAMPGSTVEETIGRNIFEYIPHEYHNLTKESIERVFRTGDIVSFETSLSQPDGTTAWISTRLGPIKLGGKVVAITQISTDITESKRTGERLSAKVQELEEFNQLALGRELKMIELKEEINQLLTEQNMEKKYKTTK